MKTAIKTNSGTGAEDVALSVDSVLTEVEAEAHRQISVCNACRYCEGYCAVFPAVHRQRIFNSGDIRQLANLCHNCRGCYYACQYSDPHEFKINIPQTLASVRLETWQNNIWPGSVARRFQRSGVYMSVASVLVITLVFLLVMLLPTTDGAGFYAHLSHTLMISIFIPAFLLPLVSVYLGLKRYWQGVGGKRIRWVDVQAACRSAGTMKNLSGGQGQGCNFESADRFTTRRRTAHQLTMYGFLLCFASTSSATLMHYLLDMPAPYAFLSVPKLLGVVGGILLVVGCFWLALLKRRADNSLGAVEAAGGEMAFVLLLGATGASGLLLYAVTGSILVKPLLALHLGIVLTFFLSMPYSKMVHGFFRMAALIREAQHGRIRE